MGQRTSSTANQEYLIQQIVIKRWFEICTARLLRRFLTVWKVHEAIEYSTEMEQGNVYHFYQDLLKYLPKKRLGSKIIFEPRKSYVFSQQDLRFVESLEKNEFEKYDFKKIIFPMNADGFKILMNHVLSKKEKILPPSIVNNIICQSIKALSKVPNINRLNILKGSECTVVGDLHGSLEDLLVIIHRNGLPKENNPIVFNGDFVDRGNYGVEVLCIVLAAYLAFPKSVYLNRGNHEDVHMNDIYGFTEEVKTKYPNHFELLLNKIHELYRWLPLATIVNDEIFIVHGGISNTIRVAKIDEIARQDFSSVVNLPNDLNMNQWKVVFDLLWSDPMESYGCVPNSKRNAGVCFGFNVTYNFLQMNRLKYIIRSHECKELGFDFNHNYKVITVFSSSNYFGPGSNCGAYIKFDTGLKPTFYKYMILDNPQRQYLSMGKSIRKLEQKIIIDVCVRLKANQTALIQAFRQEDREKNGIIHFRKWEDCLRKKSFLDIPWVTLRHKLAPRPRDVNIPINFIFYPATLKLLDSPEVKKDFENYISPTQQLTNNREALEAIFNVMDLDGSGEITRSEIDYIIEVVSKHFPTTRSKAEMLKSFLLIDSNHDGKIDLDEFLDGFQNCIH